MCCAGRGFLGSVGSFSLAGIWDLGLSIVLEQDNEVCICTLVYNQGAFLREFIEYHRLVGVSAFIFYDNNSDDDTEEVLSPYLCSDRVGEDGLAVRVVNWNFPNFKFFPSRDWPQKQAFAHCLEQFGARPEDDMELRMDGTYKIVHKGNRHQLRAQDEKRPQCGYISFTDTDEFIVPDPFIARDAMEPSEEIPRIVRKYRANETADNGVMTIVMPPYTVGHSNVIEVPPKMRSHRLELFTHRSRNVTRGEKRLVARKYYPALANRIHIWGRSFANFEYDSDALRSIEAVDFDRRCPSDAPPECDPEPELAMYHHRWGSWKDFISKWKYYGNLKVNTTFVNEVRCFAKLKRAGRKANCAVAAQRRRLSLSATIRSGRAEIDLRGSESLPFLICLSSVPPCFPPLLKPMPGSNIGRSMAGCRRQMQPGPISIGLPLTK